MQRSSGRRLTARSERLEDQQLSALQQLKNLEPYTTNLQLATLTGTRSSRDKLQLITLLRCYLYCLFRINV